MISENLIRKFMDAVFINPQRILGGLTGDGERKLDDVHLVFVKLLSGTPLKGRGAKLDPIILKIGFTGIDDELGNVPEDILQKIITELKMFDAIIGSWTLVHDIPATEEIPQWRMSAEICSRSVREAIIETTEEDNSRKILCVDFEGVGIFMGKSNCKNKNPDKF